MISICDCDFSIYMQQYSSSTCIQSSVDKIFNSRACGFYHDCFYTRLLVTRHLLNQGFLEDITSNALRSPSTVTIYLCVTDDNGYVPFVVTISSSLITYHLIFNNSCHYGSSSSLPPEHRSPPSNLSCPIISVLCCILWTIVLSFFAFLCWPLCYLFVVLQFLITTSNCHRHMASDK